MQDQAMSRSGVNGPLVWGCLSLILGTACNYESNAHEELDTKYEATGEYRSVLDVVGDVDSDGATDFFWGRGTLDWSGKREHHWEASVISGKKGITIFELTSSTHLIGFHGAGPVSKANRDSFASFWIGAHRLADGDVDYQLRSGDECKLLKRISTGGGLASRGFGLVMGAEPLEFSLEDSENGWELSRAQPSKKFPKMKLEPAKDFGKWEGSGHLLRAWRVVSPDAFGAGPAMHLSYENLLTADAGSILYGVDGKAYANIVALTSPLLERFRVESSADWDGDGDRDSLYLDYSNGTQVMQCVSWPDGKLMFSIPFEDEQVGTIRDYAVGSSVDQPLLVYSVGAHGSNRRSEVTACLLPKFDVVWSVSLDVFGGWQIKQIGDVNGDNVSDFIAKGFRGGGWGSALYCLSGIDGSALWER